MAEGMREEIVRGTGKLREDIAFALRRSRISCSLPNAVEVADVLLPIIERAVMAERERASREGQAIWRCCIGDVTSALDLIRLKWASSKRKNERKAGAVLAPLLDLIWAARDPAPSIYSEANAAGKVLQECIAAAIRAEGEGAGV